MKLTDIYSHQARRNIQGKGICPNHVLVDVLCHLEIVVNGNPIPIGRRGDRRKFSELPAHLYIECQMKVIICSAEILSEGAGQALVHPKFEFSERRTDK